MRSSLVVFAGLLVGSACDDGEVDAAACPTSGHRVIDGEAVQLSWVTAPSLAGEHVVFASGMPGPVFAATTCGGAATLLRGEELGGAFALTGEEGALALGHRVQAGEVVLLDRLDVPGVDAPRVIATLDPIDSGWFRWPEGLLLWSGPLMRGAPEGSRVFVYPGPEGPLRPAVELASDVVWLARGGLDGFALRTASGELMHVQDGAATSLHASVRSAGLAPDGAHAAWQDVNGGWTLHSLARGEGVPLGPTAKARSAGPDAAAWRWTDAAVAAIDANGGLIAAYDRRDGTRLADPPGHGVVRADEAGPLFFLTAQVAPERVELAWDPHEDALTEWYRGPDVGLHPQVTAAGIRYLAEPGSLYLHRPGRVPTLLQAEASLDALALADGRTLMSLTAADETHRLVLLDASGAQARTIAEGVARWSVTAEEPPRLTYAIASGPDAGVWISGLDG